MIVVVAVLSAISAFIKKQQETKNGQGAGAPTAKPQSNWAEELRRMLEGEEAKPLPPVRRPPPVVVQKIAPPPFVKPPPARIAAARSPAMAEVEGEAARMAPMRESQGAYDQASQLDESVGRHIAKVPGQHVGSTAVKRRQVSPDAAQAIAFFKNARTARQAVMVAAIFGPPKALE